MATSPQRLVTIPHTRCRWNGNEKVLVCTTWDRLKGADGGAWPNRQLQIDYSNAKQQGDFAAAGRVVGPLFRESEHVIDELVEALTPFILRRTPLVCVIPHPGFDDEDGAEPDIAARSFPRNTIPQTYAAFVASEIDAEMDEVILERERVGRTKLTKMERFLWQPSFMGAVRPDVAYVLVDDVLTLGGTLAALRSYIISNGGTVAAATALAHSSGRHQALALSRETWDDLIELFGARLDGFWREEVGHGADCLTEAEGRHLIAWARKEAQGARGPSLLQCLRTCLSRTATSGR